MGTPVPTAPLDYGDDCSHCTPPLGELWEPDKTPLNLYAYFAGIKQRPGVGRTPPNGKTFKLTQVDDYPCVWRHDGSVWKVYFTTDPPGVRQSRLVLQTLDDQFYFNAYGPGCPPETTIYANEASFASPQCDGEEGIAVIHWMGIVLTLVAGLSLPFASKLMHELFVTDEDQIVHKFCMPKYSMNVKMLLE